MSGCGSQIRALVQRKGRTPNKRSTPIAVRSRYSTAACGGGRRSTRLVHTAAISQEASQIAQAYRTASLGEIVTVPLLSVSRALIARSHVQTMPDAISVPYAAGFNYSDNRGGQPRT